MGVDQEGAVGGKKPEVDIEVTYSLEVLSLWGKSPTL